MVKTKHPTCTLYLYSFSAISLGLKRVDAISQLWTLIGIASGENLYTVLRFSPLAIPVLRLTILDLEGC